MAKAMGSMEFVLLGLALVVAVLRCSVHAGACAWGVRGGERGGPHLQVGDHMHDHADSCVRSNRAGTKLTALALLLSALASGNTVIAACVVSVAACTIKLAHFLNSHCMVTGLDDLEISFTQTLTAH